MLSAASRLSSTTSTRRDLLPPLRDVQLLHAEDDCMVLGGFEREDLSRRDQAQTWVLTSNWKRNQDR
jgi:hypothetical protein